MDLLLLLRDLLIKIGLQVVALLLELLLQIVELLCGLLLTNNRLPLRWLDRPKHTVVIPLFVLSLVAFLIKLDLKELQLLVVDGLVLLEFRLEIIVLLLDFFE